MNSRRAIEIATLVLGSIAVGLVLHVAGASFFKLAIGTAVVVLMVFATTDWLAPKLLGLRRNLQATRHKSSV